MEQWDEIAPASGSQLVGDVVLEDLYLFDEIDFIAHFHDSRKGQLFLNLLLGGSEINTVDGSVIGVAVDTGAIVAVAAGFSQADPLSLTKCVAHNGESAVRRSGSR